MRQIFFTGILGLAVTNDYKYLITQRNQPQNPEIHKRWQIPGGGVEYGKQPEETLFRELEEELTLKPLILFPNPIVKTQVWQRKSSAIHLTLACYIISIGHQKPIINDRETLDWRWVTKSELYRIDCLPLTKVFIDETDQICNRYSLLSS